MFHFVDVAVAPDLLVLRNTPVAESRVQSVGDQIRWSCSNISARAMHLLASGNGHRRSLGKSAAPPRQFKTHREHQNRQERSVGAPQSPSARSVNFEEVWGTAEGSLASSLESPISVLGNETTVGVSRTVCSRCKQR
jgi:hypothetical protein